MPVYPAPLPNRVLYGNRGNTYAALGDSIAQGNTAITVNGTLAGSRDWLAYACMASGGAMRYAFNAGKSGDTTAQILARVQTEVLARTDFWGRAVAKPAKCFVQGGTNDPAGGLSFTQTTTNLTAIYATLAAGGVEPILLGLPPYGTNQTGRAFYSRVNAWVARTAAANGWHFIDLQSVGAGLIVPSTGGWVAGTNNASDGVHPSAVGARLIGAYIAAQLAGRGMAHTPMLAHHVDDWATGGALLNSGGLFLANSGGIGTGYSQNGTLTPTTVSGDTNILGNWQQTVSAVANNPDLSQAVSSGWAAGDLLQFSCLVNTVAEGTSGTANVRVYHADAGFTTFPAFGLQAFATDITRGYWCFEWRVPPNMAFTTIQFTNNNATLKVAQVALVNLTTQGF